MYDSCRTPRVAVLAAEAPLLGRPTLISCLTWQSAAAGLEACIFANVPGSGLHMLGQPRKHKSQRPWEWDTWAARRRKRGFLCQTVFISPQLVHVCKSLGGISHQPGAFELKD